MYCDNEFDVQNSCERLYTVHGQFIECLADGIGNVFVNLEDVRRSGFAVYSEEDLNFSIEQKRGIILDDFYQYMLSQAMMYLNKNKELHKYIGEEQILNTIERCRIKLLGDVGENKCNDRLVNQTNTNFKISVPNRRGSRDKPPGGRHDRDSFSEKNISFGENSSTVRPPKNLPSNFTPTQTHRSFDGPTQLKNRNSISNKNKPDTDNWQGFNQNRNSRSLPKNNKDVRDNEQSQPNQNYKDSQFEKKKQHTVKNNFDSRDPDLNQDDSTSQTSGSSEKKITLMKALEAVDFIEKVKFEIKEKYDVLLTEVEKNNICWVQKVDSITTLEELHLAIMEESSEFKEAKDLKRGQLGLTEFEDIWCRCRVMSLNPLTVLFIDYGNKANVKEVKELPNKFKNIPALAARIVVHKVSQDLKVDMNLTIKVKTKYEDDTYLVEVQGTSNSEALKEDHCVTQPPHKIENNNTHSDVRSTNSIEKPKAEKQIKSYFDLPKPLAELKNNDKVMLLNLIGSKMAVKTKECVQKSKELLEYIKSLDKSDLNLTQVQKGQLVLGSKDGLPNLCRAVVTDTKSPTAVAIKYLDYTGVDNVSIKSLRNVDEYLATHPITLILTPEIEVLNTITEKGIAFITSLIENKEKATVVFSENNDFDLKLADETLFTEKLLELEKSSLDNSPKSVPDKDISATPKHKEIEETKGPQPETTNSIITFNDMGYFKPKIGETNTYICYTLKDLSEITLISMDEDSVENLQKVTDLEIDDDKPYSPELHEMCVFLYKTPEESEPAWYRGVVMDVVEDEYSISMVDFGTLVTTTSKNIRKFPISLKEIPMLGIFCELTNIPHTEEVLKAIRSLVTEGDDIEVTVKKENDLTYEIELPKIYNELKKLKLF